MAQAHLGVMVAEELRGPLCWAAAMYDEGNSVRIESRSAPAPPTEEELEAAKVWKAVHRQMYIKYV